MARRHSCSASSSRFPLFVPLIPPLHPGNHDLEYALPRYIYDEMNGTTQRDTHPRQHTRCADGISSVDFGTRRSAATLHMQRARARTSRLTRSLTSSDFLLCILSESWERALVGLPCRHGDSPQKSGDASRQVTDCGFDDISRCFRRHILAFRLTQIRT